MNNNFEIFNPYDYTAEELKELNKLIHTYLIIRTTLSVVLIICFFMLCVAVSDMTKELQHMLYHVYDCCNSVFN